MNIFYLDPDPRIAAQMQCDKHVVKMIVESAQMLSTAHRMLDGTLQTKTVTTKSGKLVNRKLWVHAEFDSVLYKAVHHNHPCTIWTRQGKGNYYWHYDHWAALCAEYTYRYGKVHATWTRLSPILCVAPNNIPDGSTPFLPAVGDYPQSDDLVSTYRNFYMEKQIRFKMKWTARPKPEWFHELST